MPASLRSNASFKSNASVKSKSKTQDLPINPTIEEMKTWESEKVLRWIQQRNLSILAGDDLDTFRKLNFSGMAFVGSDFRFFNERCHLSAVASLGLETLVDEVKNGNQSNQTAGRKRKGDEIEAPEELPISLKRLHLEDTSSRPSKARERRKRIREIIKDLDDSSDPDSPYHLPGAVNKLSDPVFEATLPFPYVGISVPTRFKVDNGNWRYVGRTKFKELLQKMEEMRVSEVYTALWLYGTQGYGKSHLLAALVCYLAAQDERVIYIPDCRSLLKNPILHVRAAMLFAWADDPTTQNEITKMSTTDEILAFLYTQEKVIFVVDQMNAFKAGGLGAKERREELRDWVGSFTSCHKTVFSSSANDTDYLDEFNKQSSNRVLRVYGGLDRTEMDQWWNRHRNVDMGGSDRDTVEDTTGRIPLLLDACVVDGKINLAVTDLQEVYENAVTFVQRTSEATEGQWSRWQWYCDFVTACFSHKPVPYGLKGHLDLVDHRYFYRYQYLDYWYGGYTCGLARDAVADQLLLRKGLDFADTDFLFALDRFVRDPSVVGFLIEHAVLSSIRSRRLSIGKGIAKRTELKRLEDPPKFDMVVTKNPVLYRPDSFNYPAVDGIIFWIKPEKDDNSNQGTNGLANQGKNDETNQVTTCKTNLEKNGEMNQEENETSQEETAKENQEGNEETNQGKNDKTNEEKNGKTKANQKKKPKLLMFPLQVTLAPETHSDSREKFFQKYGKCITDLSEFDLELEFLWITPERRDGQEYPASENPPRPKHRESYIPFKTVNKDIWEQYQRYEAAKKSLETNEPKAAKPKAAATEVATTEGATTKAAQTEAAQTEAAQTEAAQTEAAQTEAAPTKRKRRATKSKAAPTKATKAKAAPTKATKSRAKQAQANA